MMMVAQYCESINVTKLYALDGQNNKRYVYFTTIEKN